jgi:hypothetical protein
MLFVNFIIHYLPWVEQKYYPHFNKKIQTYFIGKHICKNKKQFFLNLKIFQNKWKRYIFKILKLLHLGENSYILNLRTKLIMPQISLKGTQPNIVINVFDTCVVPFMVYKYKYAIYFISIYNYIVLHIIHDWNR